MESYPEFLAKVKSTLEHSGLEPDYTKLGPDRNPYSVRIVEFLASLPEGDLLIMGIGSHHSSDIAHPSYQASREITLEFLQKTQGGERVVIVEGGLRDVDPLMADEDIFSHPEREEIGYVQALAMREEVEVISAEPDDAIFADLAQKYGASAVLDYLAWRMQPQLARNPNPDKPSLEAFMTYALETFRMRLQDFPEFTQADFSYEALCQRFAEYFPGLTFEAVASEGTEFIINQTDHRRIVAAELPLTPVQEVALEHNKNRDRHLLATIIAQIFLSRHVLFVCGESHARIIEEQLEVLMQMNAAPGQAHTRNTGRLAVAAAEADLDSETSK